MSEGLREKKKARTRALIRRVAIERFAERGFEAITAHEIAEAAGVGRRTFFRYFPSKEEVVFAAQGERLARFAALVSEPLSGESPFQTVRRALLSMAEVLMVQREEVVALQKIVEASPLLLARERIFDRDWDALVAKALSRGGQMPEHRTRMMAGALVGAVRATLRIWFDDEGRGDLGALGAEALTLVEKGLIG